MISLIVSFLVGVLLVVIGITNIRGNISTLHSYHRRRVSKEDIKPFGKMIGIGTIICGCAIMIFSIFNVIAKRVQIFSLVGTIILIIGLIVGSIICFWAMIKYNKGIF